MTTRRTWFALALLLLAPALARAADNGDPLPDGAKARLGTARLRAQSYGTSILSPDGKTLYSAGANGLFRLDPATGARLEKVPAAHIGTLTAFSADGKRAVHTSYDRLTVWDTDTGKAVAKLDRRLPSTSSDPVALSADGKILAAGGVGDRTKKIAVTVLVRDIAADKELATITVPQNDQSFVALSADGKMLANWGSHYDPDAKPTDADNNPGRFVYFWDATTGKELGKFRVSGYMASAVAFSPAGGLCAVASNGIIDLVDPKTGTSKRQLLGRARIGRFLAFSPDGATVAATGDDGAVQRWKTADGARLSTTEAPAANIYSTRVRLTSNESGIAWGTRGIATMVWAVPSGKFIGPEGGHTSQIRSVAMTADNKHVITSADDGTALRWELTTGKPAGEVAIKRPNTGYGGYSAAAVLSADAARALVLDSGGGIGVHDLATGVQQYVIPSPQDAIAVGTFSADGTKIIVSSASTYDYKKKPARVTVWDAAASTKLGSVELPGYSLVTAAVTPDGKYLITAGTKPVEKGTSKFVITGWELATGAKKGELSEDSAYFQAHVTAAPDNKTAAVVTAQGKLIAFDLLTGAKGTTYDTKSRAPGVAPVFSPDGKSLAVTCQSSFSENPASPVLVFDWASGDAKHTFASPGQTPQAVAFSPDGKWLITGAPDTTATVWDLSK